MAHLNRIDELYGFYGFRSGMDNESIGRICTFVGSQKQAESRAIPRRFTPKSYRSWEIQSSSNTYDPGQRGGQLMGSKYETIPVVF